MAAWLARRFVGGLSPRGGLLLGLLPLVFTGKAMLLGQVYGPVDLAYAHDPWKTIAAEKAVTEIANPILSDLQWANLPWRAAVREALVNGRFPFWNRFVLAGNPLLASAQAGIFHPATWLGVLLPLPLSWTFSCTFTIFLGLLSGFLFFRDSRLSSPAAAIGAVGWGFSTFLLFWNGWSIGPSTASFPLLLLGLRRVAHGAKGGVGLTVCALLLSFAGGHPESFFHGVWAAGVYFLWELYPTVRGLGNSGRSRSQVARAIASALAAGALALLLAGPQLFPMLEAIPHSAEYRHRRAALEAGRSSQSVDAAEAARRLVPSLLPFAHGVYGKSPVQAERGDGSGMPLGYSGALLFPLAAVSLLSRHRRERGPFLFLGFFLAGLLFGASAPGLLDLVTKLPGFELALNYRLVFLAALGLSGLAAFGAENLLRHGTGRLGETVVAAAALLTLAFALSVGIFAERQLPQRFVLISFGYEVIPLMLFGLAIVALRRKPLHVVAAAFVLLIVQRGLEMRATYPTLPGSALAPPLAELESLPREGPFRVAAAGDVFRPNSAALYGLEDVRGYESLVLDRFADTYPLWCQAQHASFNRIDDLRRPFLSFLNARFAIASPDSPVPAGWRERLRTARMAIFENPAVLSRAFLPRRVRLEPDPQKTLDEMSRATGFSDVAWVRAGSETSEQENGSGTLSTRTAGPDVIVTADVTQRALVATSLPDWPGWRAQSSGHELPLVTTNHAFVGFWLPPGPRTVRLHYRSSSFSLGLICFGVGVVFCLGNRLKRKSAG